jgi:hypothetical protein
MKKHFGFFVALLLLAACVPRSAPVGRGGTAWGQGAFDSNGERIYFTATSERGGRITYTGGLGIGGMMMGGTLACASCHGPTGRGGQHIMHMQVMDAPDIRWSALVGEAGEGHGDEGDEHGGDAADYDLETFRLAVVEGKHPDGEPLDADMPRWTMSEEDLSDLLEYLKDLE